MILAEPVPLCPNCREVQAYDLGVKAEEIVSSQVVATVDVVRSDVIVWWTNVRPERTSSIARNCGAWSLPKNDVESLQVLLSNKVCLPTPTGRRHLDSVSPGRQTLLDPGATLAFVLGEQLRLSTILATAKTKSSAKALRWPARNCQLVGGTLRVLGVDRGCSTLKAGPSKARWTFDQESSDRVRGSEHRRTLDPRVGSLSVLR